MDESLLRILVQGGDKINCKYFQSLRDNIILASEGFSAGLVLVIDHVKAEITIAEYQSQSLPTLLGMESAPPPCTDLVQVDDRNAGLGKLVER